MGTTVGVARCRKIRNTKNINELMKGLKRVAALKARSETRSRILKSVREALPEHLANAVVTAGVDQGRLSVGVSAAVWAARIRYFLPAARARLKEQGIEVVTARVRVVPPGET